MEPLDEKALRHPDFVEGSPVTLADGQVWQVRKPVLWFEPTDANQTGFRICLEIEPGDRYQELIDARERALEADASDHRGRDIIAADIAIFRALVLANYEMTTEQLARVLRVSYDSESNPRGAEIRRTLLDVAEGRGPKPSPDGDESPPTPSEDSPGGTG